ncbi:MAG: hypothetical protein OHK0031_11750 [Anaerolineales bacterium]
MAPEDQSIFLCYGLCLLGMVFTLGGLYLESRAAQRRAKKDDQPK